MGYESRLFIVNRVKFSNNDIWGDIVACYNLSKLGDNNFSNVSNLLFKTPIDFKLPFTQIITEESFDADTGISKGEYKIETDTDHYGDLCKYASISDVIKSLEKYIEINNYYRRLNPLLSMLKCFEREIDHWDDLIVVHWGY